jgi:cytochrome c551/c552
MFIWVAYKCLDVLMEDYFGSGRYKAMNFRLMIGMLLLAVGVLLPGCGKQVSNPNTLSAAEDAHLFKLAQLNGCIECHTVTSTSIGPSWMAVAERYKEAPRAETRALLINSVMNGSKGKWITWRGGDGMPPLGKRVVKEDVEELVDFILSLNRQTNG